jgi:hypothetical protein
VTDSAAEFLNPFPKVTCGFCHTNKVWTVMVMNNCEQECEPWPRVRSLNNSKSTVRICVR